MRRPKYNEELLKTIFLWLGVGFIVMGLLSFIGILEPTAYSWVQEPNIMGMIFLIWGVAFFIVQTILGVIASSKDKLHNELLVSGTQISGTVEKVYLQIFTQYAGKYPYRIIYTYTCQGKTYHQKSALIWDKPDCMENDTIIVYVNDSGKSTIQI